MADQEIPDRALSQLNTVSLTGLVDMDDPADVRQVAHEMCFQPLVDFLRVADDDTYLRALETTRER